MTATSVFEFRFPANAADEGGTLTRDVGHDMTLTEGYISHEVITDGQDAGHIFVITRWHEQQEGNAVLSAYINNPKIERAGELAGAAPTGFLGRSDD